ncbi:hypothetical protein [Rickettsiella endosymbiont of Dermanyssus gallinae]|uniref:hypothetical protein n=1 Tax=Rickettsiella endosymbiont of Dermanyssus gallinae TaxID=2856608 RepID=UPI001C532ED9|nr:hypothetical protein [Rickettsiella endosymbiont of Dermanyssus gallinae]
MFEDAHDFYNFFKNLGSEQQRRYVFDYYKEGIVDLINSMDSFTIVTHGLEPDQRRSVFDSVKRRLASFIHNSNDLSLILTELEPAQRTELLLLLKGKLASILQNVYDFLIVVKGLESEQRRYILNAYHFYGFWDALEAAQRRELFDNFKEMLVSIIDSPHSFIVIIKDLRPDQYRYVFDGVKQRLSSLIQHVDDLYILLGHLEPKYRTDMLVTLKGKLAVIINNLDDFVRVIKNLDHQQSRYVFNACDFYNRFRALSTKRRRQVFDNFKETLVSIIDTVYDFDIITKGLRSDQRHYVFENIKQRLSSIIHSVDDFTILLEHLKSDQRRYVINNLKETVASIMHSTEDFSTLFEHLSTAEWNIVIQHYERIQSENCLPGPSGYHPPARRKRNTLEEGCEISWKDVDEFNEEKEKSREFSEIKINSEQFLVFLADPSLSETKRAQLLQLPDKTVVTGAANDQVGVLVEHQKTLMYLNKLGRVSGMAMYGMMAENTLKDFFQEDYTGVAINIGFIAGGQVFAKLAEKASIKGTKLILNDQRLLGRSFRMASPFLARGTSVYIVYDLVNQIKSYQQGNPDAVAGIMGDSIFLGVDGAEIGIEIAEGLGFLEGVSSVTGPIGATIGAVVFIGTDVYLAVKQVDKIDALIHLSSTEKFIEGLRAFVGMNPKQYLQHLMEEKQANNRLFKQGIDFLKNHTSLQRAILPTANVVEVCNTLIYRENCPDIALCHTISHRANCSPLDFLGCQPDQFGNYFKYKTRKDCTNKLDIYLNNTVLLDRKVNDIHWSRTKPDALEGDLFCAPTGDDGAIPSEGAYFCDKAMGIEYADARTGNTTLINLGDGNDRVIGFPQGDHVVIVGNGHKIAHLGDGNDSFLLEGHTISGTLHGGNGTNTLDLGLFAKEQKTISVNLKNTRSLIYFTEQAKNQLIPLRVNRISNILLRANKQDSVRIGCHTRYSDARGGENQHNPDVIFIPKNKHCEYALKLIIRPYTNVLNHARNRNSQFTYSVPIVNKGEAAVSLLEAGGLHRFAFAYTLNDINRLEKTNNTLSLSFIEDQIDTRLINDTDRYGIENEFTLRITQYASNQLVLQLSDNAEIRVEGNNFYAFQSTNRSIDDIIKDCSKTANRLKLTIFVQSLPSNETIAIGHGKHDVLPNDPYRRSHLIGNGGENVFVIRSGHKILDVHKLPLPEVVIYDRDDANLIDTLDLREISNQLQKDLGLSVQARTMLIGDDVAIALFTSMQGVDCLISTIRLKNAVLKKWTSRLHIVLQHAPMKMDAGWALKPIPLEFPHDKDIMVINPEDVEENTTIVSAKKAGDYHFYRLGDNLLISNVLDSRITESERYALSLQAFYQTPKLESLSIVFEDKSITLKHEIARIKNATAFKDQITHYRQAKNNLLFNKAPEHPAVHQRKRRDAKNSASHSAICGAIRHRFFKSPLPQVEGKTNNIPGLKIFNPSQFDGSGLLLLMANLLGCKLAPVPTEENDPRFYSEDFVLQALQKKF